MIQKFLNQQTKSASIASMILAVAYVASAALGLLRDRLLAGSFGAGNELDVYYTAFTIPDFIALILIFGAISAAIIPVFSSYLVKSKEDAWKFISALMNVFLGFLIIVCAILAIFTPYFISIIAPGFTEEKKQMAVLLMRIMFLSPIILGASNIISGVLQVFHRFLVTALAPIMYNAGIILGIFFIVPKMGIQGLAWGVVLGGVLHLLIQLPAFYFSGFKYKISFNLKHPGVLKTIKLMAPRSLGLGAGQLNTIAITAIASTLTVGSIAVFNLANNLSSMFINAVAVSVSTAVFPSLSLHFSGNQKKQFLDKFSSAFRQTLFLIIPLSLLLFLLRVQIVRVILGAGKFDWVDTRLTAACLGILSLSLFAQGLIFILSKTFYAAHNTKIPATISLLTVVFNISISLLFVWLLKVYAPFFNFLQEIFRLEGIQNIGVAGLALAFSVTAVLEFFLLFFFLCKKFPELNTKEILNSVNKILASCLVMIILAFTVRQTLGGFVSLQNFWGVFLQLALSGTAGLASYFISAMLLKSPEMSKITNFFYNESSAN